MNNRQAKIVKKYYALTKTLNAYVEKSALDFNNTATDRLSKKRQFYQHHKIRKVIKQREEFSKQFVISSSGTQISLQKAYESLSDFWDLRNKTMAKNIIATVRQNQEKKIVVLTGFFHRYYLKSEIHKQARDIKVAEFYDN